MLPPELLDEILKLCDLDSLANCARTNTVMLPAARYNLYHTLVYSVQNSKLKFMDLHNTAPLLTHTRRLLILFDGDTIYPIYPDLFKSLVGHGKLETLTASISSRTTELMEEVLRLPSMNRFRMTASRCKFTNYPHLKDLSIHSSSDLFHNYWCGFKLDTLRIFLGHTTRRNVPQNFVGLSTVRRVTLRILLDADNLESQKQAARTLMDVMGGVTHASLRLAWYNCKNPRTPLSIFSPMRNFTKLTSLVLATYRGVAPSHILRLSVTLITQLVHPSAPLKTLALWFPIFEDLSVSGEEEGWYELGQATKHRGVELEVHLAMEENECENLVVVPQIIEGVDRIVVHHFRDQEDGQGWALLDGESTDWS